MFRLMFMLVALIVLSSTVCFSPQNYFANYSNQTESEKIICNARQAIGLDKIVEISSYFYKSKEIISLNDSNSYESFEEVDFKAPDRFQAVYRSESPFFGSINQNLEWRKI